jgi:hypothetical protein
MESGYVGALCAADRRINFGNQWFNAQSLPGEWPCLSATAPRADAWFMAGANYADSAVPFPKNFPTVIDVAITAAV